MRAGNTPGPRRGLSVDSEYLTGATWSGTPVLVAVLAMAPGIPGVPGIPEYGEGSRGATDRRTRCDLLRTNPWHRKKPRGEGGPYDAPSLRTLEKT